MTLLLYQQSKHTLFLVWRNLPHSSASISENKELIHEEEEANVQWHFSKNLFVENYNAFFFPKQQQKN